jgi:hypothetical protein
MALSDKKNSQAHLPRLIKNDTKCKKNDTKCNKNDTKCNKNYTKCNKNIL